MKGNGTSFAGPRQELFGLRRGGVADLLASQAKLSRVATGLDKTSEKLGGIKGLAAGPDGILYAVRRWCPSAHSRSIASVQSGSAPRLRTPRPSDGHSRRPLGATAAGNIAS